MGRDYALCATRAAMAREASGGRRACELLRRQRSRRGWHRGRFGRLQRLSHTCRRWRREASSGVAQAEGVAGEGGGGLARNALGFASANI